MKKLAIFVEGRTEQVFVIKLLTEIVDNKSIFIEEQKNTKGENFKTIRISSKTSEQKYYILICDCRNDERIKTSIIDRCKKLYENKYEKILGLRDVYPFELEDVPKLKKWSLYNVPTKYMPIHIILAQMEVEAWFLAETTHFPRIHSSLTLDAIKNVLNFDPSVDDVEIRTHPAQDLHNVYSLANFAYTKKERNINRTVNALDYSNIYLNLKDRIKNLSIFIEEIDSFLI